MSEFMFVWSKTDTCFYLRNSRTNRWLGTKIFKGLAILDRKEAWYITSSNELDPHWWINDTDPKTGRGRSRRMPFDTSDDAKAYATFIYESLGELE